MWLSFGIQTNGLLTGIYSGVTVGCMVQTHQVDNLLLEKGILMSTQMKLG